jgi:hypothetical protein
MAGRLETERPGRSNRDRIYSGNPQKSGQSRTQSDQHQISETVSVRRRFLLVVLRSNRVAAAQEEEDLRMRGRETEDHEESEDNAEKVNATKKGQPEIPADLFGEAHFIAV